MEETFKGYTDFVDDIEENSFDNFLMTKLQQKRKSIRQYMEEGYSQEDATALAKKDAKKGGIGALLSRLGVRAEGESKKKPEGYGTEGTSPEGTRNVGNKAKRKARLKNLMQELIKKAKAEGRELSQEEVEQVKNIQIEEDIVLRDKGISPISATSLSGANADSFFQKNKKALMIAGAVAVAGIVYFKFIKK